MAPASMEWNENSLHEKGFIRDEDERPKVPHNKFSDEIPVISLEGIDDLEGSDGGVKSRRAEICEKIVKACEDWGIFQVVDHGIDAKLLSEMTRLAREFFQLPAEEKLRFDMTGGKKGGFIVSSHLQVIITRTYVFMFTDYIMVDMELFFLSKQYLDLLFLLKLLNVFNIQLILLV